jgi:HNH endonuclease
VNDNKPEESPTSDQATPQEVEVPAVAPAPPQFGLHDSSWSNDQWYDLLQSLVDAGVVSWKDVCALVLGHLNPSQVGTSLASSEGFKRKYGKGNTMKIVMEWAYAQKGKCADCGSRLELQADHIKGREQFSDKLDADYIENMILRCRRCNVIRRPSHELGGLTYLTAEAALMWILFVIRPRIFRDYVRMCRLYGMTMSDIRMSEAWAMAHWLSRDHPPAYGIEDDQQSEYDLVLWPDSAITRVDPEFEIPGEATRMYSRVPGGSILGFITIGSDGKLRFYEQSISFIPFSTYDLGGRPPQSLAILYTPPDRKGGQRQRLIPLPPRDSRLLVYGIRSTDEVFRLTVVGAKQQTIELDNAPVRGRILKIPVPANGFQLEAMRRQVLFS